MPMTSIFTLQLEIKKGNQLLSLAFSAKPQLQLLSLDIYVYIKKKPTHPFRIIQSSFNYSSS